MPFIDPLARSIIAPSMPHTQIRKHDEDRRILESILDASSLTSDFFNLRCMNAISYISYDYKKTD
ncbi:hypothetical protein BS628_15580 [Agrobacterium radiobacter]|nr:hypothetical protein ASH09_07635 [Agrobacterium radiobacter]OOO35538.1 hypothetical protein BS628_15580 [Agrobacterium radiobacter]